MEYFVKGVYPMRTSFNLRASRIGYTLVEMLVVLAAVSTLSALAVGVVARSRASTRGIRCLNNLRQISAGLVMHHEKYGTLPDPKERVLPAMLAEFISDEKLFVCPSSPYPTTDSYSQYYLPRVPLEETGFVLGCPNHVGEDMALA